MAIEAVPDDLCSFPVTDGNKLDIILDGYDALETIIQEIKNAEKSVWITASYFDADLPVPNDNIKLLDFLDSIAKPINGKDGIDVRILFWTTNIHGLVDRLEGKTFSYHDETLDRLQNVKNIKIRWDEKKSFFKFETGCHHQKSFIIDGNISFCGGVNMNASYIDKCDHPVPHPFSPYDPNSISIHDFFVKIEGPATACIMANFIQRWNEASLYEDNNIAYPTPGIASNLNFPPPNLFDPGNIGSSKVQVIRTIDKGLYSSLIPVPDHPSYRIESGEHSIWYAYVEAIKKAQNYIYIENQYFYYNGVGSTDIFDALQDAARNRNVKIIVVVPSNKRFDFTVARTSQMHLYALSGKNVLIMNLVSPFSANGKLQWNDIYIHAKLMMVDDVWLTIGSANISNQSLDSDSEMNLSIWDQDLIRDLRVKLWSGYLGCSNVTILNCSVQKVFDMFSDKLQLNSLKPIPNQRTVTVLPWTPPPDLLNPSLGNNISM